LAELICGRVGTARLPRNDVGMEFVSRIEEVDLRYRFRGIEAVDRSFGIARIDTVDWICDSLLRKEKYSKL